MKRVRCWWRSKMARLFGVGWHRRVIWDGHCWGDDGRCIDCGKP